MCPQLDNGLSLSEKENLLPPIPEEQPIVDLNNPEAIAAASPADVEKELIKEQTPQDPMAGIASLIATYKIPFINLVNNASNKALRRLIKALVLLPLEDFVPNMKEQNERMAWQIGEKLLHAKLTLIHYTALEETARQEEEKQKILAEQKVSELIESNNGKENENAKS